MHSVTAASLDYQQDDAFFLDDDHIAFYQTGKDLDVGQIFVLNIHELNAVPYQLTEFPVDVSNVKFYGDSKLLAFSAAVYEDGSLDGARKRDEKTQNEKKDSALAFDSLMVRHWDEFSSEKKNNIFIIKLEVHNGKYRLDGAAKNLLKGANLVSAHSGKIVCTKAIFAKYVSRNPLFCLLEMLLILTYHLMVSRLEVTAMSCRVVSTSILY